MAADTKHKWVFPARFRKSAFGWRSSKLAVQRVKEAVSEIKKAARKDPALGGEGAVLFLEKVSSALAHVDSSSGAIGKAVNKAIADLVPIIVKAPVIDTRREKWLERLWQAVEEDNIPYIELLPDYWGELCVTPERASRWADEFIGIVHMIWGHNRAPGDYFKGTTACLSSLFKAGRYDEILKLLEMAPYKIWHYRQWGVKALLAQSNKSKALRYAEDSRGLNVPDDVITETCEAILLSSGMAEEAYRRYALEANLKSTYLAAFRAIVRKYPNKEPAEILNDLVDSTPGDEGKWFAAAKSVGLYDKAIELANRTPCDPKTLIRAAQEMADIKPQFAVEAGIAALRWLAEGYGYEITGLDVRAACNHTMKAAENAGCKHETLERIRELISKGSASDIGHIIDNFLNIFK
jgi:hypothetical protein